MDVWINGNPVGKIDSGATIREFVERFCGFLPQSLEDPPARIELILWLASGKGRPRNGVKMFISYKTIEANIDPLIRLGAALDQSK